MLPRHSDRVEVTADARRCTLAPAELEGLPGAERHGQGQADSRVRLAIVVLDAVDRAATSGVPGRVHGEPQSGPEGVAGVELQRADGVLLPARPAKEIVVVREQPDAGVALQVPAADGIRDT